MVKYVLMADQLIAEKHHDLSRIRELTEDEVETLSTALALVGSFNGSYSLYEICDQNYKEMVEFYERTAQTVRINQEFAHDVVITLNRRLLNYLSSFRTFIDHQERKLKRLRSSDTDWFRLFKGRTAFHYDNNFSYRFFWGLRNYVQHCGLPLGGFRVAPKQDKDGNQVRHFSAYFDRDSLINNFDGWKTVKDDLEKQPEHIEIMPHVHTLKSCIDDLAMLAAEINLKRLGTYWDFLVGLDNEVTSAFPDAFPCIGRFETKSDSSIDFLGFKPLPLQIMMTIQKIRSRISDVADDSVKVG